MIKPTLFCTLIVVLTVVTVQSTQAQNHFQQDGYRIARSFPSGWQNATEQEPAAFDLINENNNSNTSPGVEADAVPRLSVEPSAGLTPPIVPADSLAHPFSRPDIQSIPTPQPNVEVGNYLESVPATGDVYNESCVANICNERYLRFFGGANWLINSDNAINQVATEQDGDYVVGLAVGKRIRPFIRTELEYAYRANKGRWQVPPNVITAPEFANGTHFSRVQSGMANVLFDIGRNRFFQPYAGVGIGLANFDGERRGTPSSNVVYTDIDRGTNFAFQAITGFEFQTRCAKLFTEYRYFATDGIGIDSNREGDYRVSNLVFGLNWSF